MIMIIGGAYQGKLAFAKKIYPDVTWADGAVCTEEELYSCEGIYHFHQYIERKIKEGEPIDDLAEELIRKNPELILMRSDTGSCRLTGWNGNTESRPEECVRALRHIRRKYTV